MLGGACWCPYRGSARQEQGQGHSPAGSAGSPLDGVIAISARIVLGFCCAAAANRIVAGVSAAARAAREVALACRDGGVPAVCDIAVPGGWAPDDWCRSELARLASGLDLRFSDLDALKAAPGNMPTVFAPGVRVVRGDAGFQADALRGAVAGHAPLPADDAGHTACGPCIEELDKVSRAIVAGTAKPGDGIVSRTINRPISQTISRFLLRYPGVTPFHATLGTAALGVAMAISLFFGGADGLIWGALLFQAASIFDGVDGEIARAAFRSSARGAMLDSMIDATTNLAFIGGVTTNLWLQGYRDAASAGAAGLAMLAVGLYLLGRRARSGNAPFSFNAVKDHFSGRRSRIMQWMTWLTMRDFFALAGAVLIMAGFGPHGLVAFAVVTTGWFLVVLAVLFRRAS